MPTGEALPDSVLGELRGHDAILLGAVGDPSVPSGVLERGLLLRLRFELDHYVNLRPVRLYPGVATPLAGRQARVGQHGGRAGGNRGPYAGAGGVLRRGTPAEIATQESINTAFGVERVVRYAFEPGRAAAAQAAHPGAQDQRAHLRRRPVAADRRRGGRRSSPRSRSTTATWTPPDVLRHRRPSASTSIVTDNLFGDILTDLGAAVAGGIGLAASGNINPERTAPSMFEPVHGSAPDIAGQQQGRPHRRDPVGRDAAASTSGCAAEAARDRAGGGRGPAGTPGRLGGAVHRGGRRRHRRASSRLSRGPMRGKIDCGAAG